MRLCPLRRNAAYLQNVRNGIDCNAGAHQRDGYAVVAIKSGDTVYLSDGALDACTYASPAAGVSVRTLRRMCAHVKRGVWHYTLMQRCSRSGPTVTEPRYHGSYAAPTLRCHRGAHCETMQLLMNELLRVLGPL